MPTPLRLHRPHHFGVRILVAFLVEARLRVGRAAEDDGGREGERGARAHRHSHESTTLAPLLMMLLLR